MCNSVPGSARGNVQAISNKHGNLTDIDKGRLPIGVMRSEKIEGTPACRRVYRGATMLELDWQFNSSISEDGVKTADCRLCHGELFGGRWSDQPIPLFNSSRETQQKKGGRKAGLSVPGILKMGGTTPFLTGRSESHGKDFLSVFIADPAEGGDFLYSDDEFNEILADVTYCKEIKCDGVVVGILDKEEM
ncbi:hypothetical protein FQR65_LT18559 [Abscondita terminalis]|nr:hypothetical protein FQR65_LT18559 [Abscondita terminalis]